jgi:esterase
VTIDVDAYLRSLQTAAQQVGLDIEEFLAPTDRQVILGSLRFHYLDWERPAQPERPAQRSIVFLHGFGLTAHTWDLVCLALRRGYRCLALDQRGHGDSEWSPEIDYGVASSAADIGAFLDELGLEQPVLVGMSMGGLNLMHYAAEHSHRLKGIVIVDTGARVHQEAFRDRAWEMILHSERDSVEDFVAQALSFNHRRDPAVLRVSLLHNLRRLTHGKWIWKYDVRHLPALSPEEIEQRVASVAAGLPSISCPALIMRGAESTEFHDEDAEATARAIPDGRWVRVENAGHNIQGDNPRGFIEALLPFLAEIGA